MRMEFGREIFRHGLKVINLFQRQKSADGLRLRRAVGGLVMVEVTKLRRRHHDVVPARGGFRAAADPIHQRRARREAALADFAPADEIFALRIHDFFNAPDEIACNSCSSFNPQCLMRAWHSAQCFQLDFITSSPPMWMYFPGNKLATSDKTFAEKVKGRVVARAINTGENAALCRA